MGKNSEKDATKAGVSRKLTGELKRGDRIIAKKTHRNPPAHVPVPHPDRDFGESLCPEGSGLDIHAMDVFDREGELFFLRGDSEAVIGPDGRTALVFAATAPTLEAYRVTLKDLLEFAGVLEEEFGYEVEIVPGEIRRERR